MTNQTIAMAGDHRGVDLKAQLIPFLEKKGFSVIDFGTDSKESCDYPDFVLKAAEAVQKGKAFRAIVICHSGIGTSIAVNKVKGVRGALVQNVEQAQMTRAHNDSNVLVLGSHYVKPALAEEIVDTWLKTPFEGGRHTKRLEKISAYEEGKFKP